MIRVVLAAAVAAAVVLSTVAGSHLTPPTQALEYSGATARGVRGHGAAVDSSPGSRGAGTKAVQRNSWVQDRLAIGFWVDPVVPPSEFQQRYAGESPSAVATRWTRHLPPLCDPKTNHALATGVCARPDPAQRLLRPTSPLSWAASAQRM